MSEISRRDPSIDIAKILCAIFVISIHTRPLSGLSELADFVLCDIIFRVAVPFFAVCTGYYLTRRMDSKRSGNRWLMVKSMAFRVFLLYVLWSVFYLIVLSVSWYKAGILELSSYIGWFKSFMIGSSYYHLWYLAQLFWALFPFHLIVKFINPKWHTLLASSLWLLGVFVYVYSDVLGIGQSFVQEYNRFGALTGMIGRMLPLLLAGTILARRPVRNNNTSVIMSLLFLGCLSIEVFVLKDKGTSCFSYVLSTLPLAFFLFDALKKIAFNPRIDTKNISKASMNIYFLHPAIVLLLTSLGIESHYILFISATVITICLCIALQFLFNGPRKVSC
ncbi:MAG: acyltransferase [Bacteroidales bacterium]|nr:acyltransferase [Bacteroidales bacterium]